MNVETYFNIDVCVINYEILRNSIINDIENNKKSIIIAINPEKIMKVRKEEKLKKIINSSTYKIPDGIGIIYASKLKKGKIKQRITGIDCMEMLCQLSNYKGYKVFLYGAKKEILEKTICNLRKKYLNLQIVGYIDGYEKDNNKIIKEINRVKPNILFVALGSPKQEIWINENKEKLGVNIFQGVGGSFDVISGNIKRAPHWMQKVGLEWLYRLIKEPKRIGRQFQLLKFLILILFERK